MEVHHTTNSAPAYPRRSPRVGAPSVYATTGQIIESVQETTERNMSIANPLIKITTHQVAAANKKQNQVALYGFRSLGGYSASVTHRLEGLA